MPDSVRKREVIDVGLSERLRAFRESLGLDQRELAQRTDTPFRTYQDYELGKSPPKVAFVQKLALLGCDIAWLLTDAPAVAKPVPWAGFTPDAELMGRVTDMIARVYRESGAALSMVDLGRLSAEKYNEIASATDDLDERFTMVKLVASQIKNDLTRSKAGSGKRSA